MAGPANINTERDRGVRMHTERAAARPTKAAGAVDVEPYFLGLDRAMVSLGPLTSNKYCTYSCKFCYVQGPYQRYARRSPDEILAWLRLHRNFYSVIYLSGDTDSFAPPRTSMALQLVQDLTELNVDVLFTTRYVFSNTERERLVASLQDYNSLG